MAGSLEGYRPAIIRDLVANQVLVGWQGNRSDDARPTGGRRKPIPIPQLESARAVGIGFRQPQIRRCEQNQKQLRESFLTFTTRTMTDRNLEHLNPEQRRAAEYGIVDSATGSGPLLIIAGAGSGKTNTLAHRVALLLAHGVDPCRILLMTFSRRAAGELCRRTKAICDRTLGDRSGLLAAGLPWSGTFHSVGARLLREYAEEIGIQPDFSIHDREDSADLLNLIRHDLGYSKTDERFPAKATCLEIYSRAVNSGAPLGDVLRDVFPWCASWEEELRALFSGYVEAKQAQHTVPRSATILLARRTGLRCSPVPSSRNMSAAASTTCWSTNIRTRTGCRPPSS